MHYLQILLLALLLTACGKPEKPPVDGHPDSELSAKRDLYGSLLPSVSDAHGFIETDKCDSLIVSSLLGALGLPVTVEAAELEPGRWLRRPTSYPECYASGGSRSTISRDMLLGVMWWAWRAKRLDVAQDLWSYGTSRDWFMGEGRMGGTDTWFVPLVPLLARLIHALGGESHEARLFPIASEKNRHTGFAAHLQVLQLLLDGELSGGLSEDAVRSLKWQYERQPRNPLFSAAYYRFSGDEGAREASTSALKDERLFPANRLPTSADRCDGWIIERDEDDEDWAPCGEGRTHSGGDFLLSEAVLSGRI